MQDGIYPKQLDIQCISNHWIYMGVGRQQSVFLGGTGTAINNNRLVAVVLQFP
jgi:hypothetical protein